MFKDEKGNVSLIAALSLSVLVPVVGFAIDAQRQMSVRQDVEASLDATVLMAARDRASESQARTFFDAQLKWRSSPTGLDLDVWVQDGVTHGRVSGHLPTFFSGLIGIDQVPVTAEAGAIVRRGASNCVLALAPDNYGVSLNSNSVIEANCGVHSNSRSSESIFANRLSFLRATSVSASGGARVNSGSAITPTAVVNAPGGADPLASLAPPRQATGSCLFTDLTVNSGATRTLSPGVYCKGITVNSGAEVRFNPGIYVIRGGELLVNSDSRISGQSVMFYLMGDKGRTNFNSFARVDLTAPTSGPYQSILFFQARDRRDDQMIINSDGNIRLEGVVYNPASELMWNSDSSGTGAKKIVISYRISGNSDSTMKINNPAGSSIDYFHPLLRSMFNSGQSGSGARLVY